ncbi:MAG: hypothetical protein K0R73_1277, partial [Candidatus Midichloriaceae bacterium]|nr:hypothetical protein [Candidatus Midichloriaceae bacterium]
PFFMLCFLLVKFINLLNMDDYGLLRLQHFQQLWGWRCANGDRRRKAFSRFFLKYTSIKLLQNNMPFYTVLAVVSEMFLAMFLLKQHVSGNKEE